MDKFDATQLLLDHAGITEGPRMEDGIIGALRPYQGLIERNLVEVLNCIFYLKDDLATEKVNNDTIRSVLVILRTMREWGMSPTGMLRSNRLINNDSFVKLEIWYNIIETTILRYLSRTSHAIALSRYLEYLAGYDQKDAIAEDAVCAAIADSFNSSEEYQLTSLAVCVKYPQVGYRFGDQVAQLNLVTPAGDLKSVIAEYLKYFSRHVQKSDNDTASHAPN
jgi:hypothetical protein